MLAVWLPLSLASTLAPPSAIVIGGSSGMGKAAAIAVASRGGSVLLASRTQAKLDSAADEIRGVVPDAELTTRVLDARDEAAVQVFAEELEANRWDALICTAAGRAPHGPIGELDTADTAALFDSKFWTAHNVCKHVAPRLADGGAVALTAGLLNRRPGMNCSPLAAVNGALEGLTRALALEFGPRLRVNCLSPGFCDTERFDHMPAERKAAMLANTAASLPLRRVGAPSDMGEALYYLVSAPFVTGVVLDCDGGHGIRQYADAASDPMRAGGGQQDAELSAWRESKRRGATAGE